MNIKLRLLQAGYTSRKDYQNKWKRKESRILKRLEVL